MINFGNTLVETTTNNTQHTHKNMVLSAILLLILWNNGFQWIKIDKSVDMKYIWHPHKNVCCICASVLLQFLADCFAFGKNVWCANILKCFCCCYRCLLLQHSWIFEESAFFITPLCSIVCLGKKSTEFKNLFLIPSR